MHIVALKALPEGERLHHAEEAAYRAERQDVDDSQAGWRRGLYLSLGHLPSAYSSGAPLSRRDTSIPAKINRFPALQITRKADIDPFHCHCFHRYAIAERCLPRSKMWRQRHDSRAHPTPPMLELSGSAQAHLLSEAQHTLP
jgi:hypothetical protein